MEYLEYFLYGLIQGLTEFIPVSSTAHLKGLSLFFGIDDPGPSLSAIIQLGSVLALVWYFRNDVFKLKMIATNESYSAIGLCDVNLHKGYDNPTLVFDVLENSIISNVDFNFNRCEKNVNKFNEMALRTITVDYAPDGFWSAYQDSHPVAVVMSLQFSELKPIYRTDHETTNVGSVGY